MDIHMARDTAEAKDREGLIKIVWFHDLADIVNGALIRIHTCSLIMKGARTRWFAITSREVDGGDHTDLPACA